MCEFYESESTFHEKKTKDKLAHPFIYTFLLVDVRVAQLPTVELIGAKPGIGANPQISAIPGSSSGLQDPSASGAWEGHLNGKYMTGMDATPTAGNWLYRALNNYEHPGKIRFPSGELQK